jgi:hypothetical protein
MATPNTPRDDLDVISEIRPALNPPTTKDKAAVFLESVEEDRFFDYAEEKAVLRRIDFRVLPLILGAYVRNTRPCPLSADDVVFSTTR